MKKIFKTIPRKKTEGITLISVVLISVLILTAVMGIANILVKELSFSTDTLNGERAYFAAESAVEEANLQLLINPIFHINDNPNKTGDDLIKLENKVFGAVNINNLSANFSITLAPNAQQTIRLQQYDKGSDTNIDVIKLPTLTIIEPQSNHTLKPSIIWTIRCKEKTPTPNNNGTVSIQGNFSQTGTNLKDFEGKIDISSKQINSYTSLSEDIEDDTDIDKDFIKLKNVSTKFWNTSAGLRQPGTCTLSLENLSEQEITINISDSEMAPEVGTVTATGHAGTRTKTIQYETHQSKVQQWINWGVVSQDK